ncbi:DUF1961 family protein [Pedobacter glucosidilyticus]|uniref:DUF1961 family protein n=1 Tax=Pedobacter glucosidilyticus TaxID=1122941 RepID=UPI0003F52B93|nr:DUF1961 family protein [Pedobacter glucosidilyticus]
MNTAIAQDLAQINFKNINDLENWKLSFQDDGIKSWQKKWFLDGLRAKVENSKHGLLFSAGDVDGDDACHAVLWTKQSFTGDIKITYNYTRTDTRQNWVNIIYIHATGIGEKPYEKDISRWSNLRMIPYMSSYFKYMNALHISYAAYDDDLPKGQDYIRLRKYPVTPKANFSKTTEIAPSYFDTGLFVPGKEYQITIIKKANYFYFHVKGDGKEKLYSWDISSALNIKEGRVGLRHMYTRAALYKNFKIYTHN